MSKRKDRLSGTMLALWRPPRDAGDPIGCLATTFTFDAGFFDEQCLARFLEIDSEPDREDLAFLLERETRLGTVYAGVLADHSQAGVEHSLRWDALPVRIPGGKQHAKLAILAWTNHVRIVITSANLTEYGYRFNHEVAGTIDLTPKDAYLDALSACVEFVESLLGFVPGASPGMQEIRRASGFLRRVRRLVGGWKRTSNKRQAVRRYPVFSLPGMQANPATGGPGQGPRCALDDCLRFCRGRGGSPSDAWVAAPFFDPPKDGKAEDEATARLCKGMARGGRRGLIFCLPAVGEAIEPSVRLAAPIGLLNTARRYAGSLAVEVLPARDGDGNLRPWHAKMLRLSSDGYTALLIGSSNFTKAGLGLGPVNAEANLLFLAERRAYAREPRMLDDLWPQMQRLEDPDAVEWLGPEHAQDEEQQALGVSLPPGFLAASYRAGDARRVVLRFDPVKLPSSWEILSCDRHQRSLLDQNAVQGRTEPGTYEVPWEPIEPPEKLLVRWQGKEGFWPVNVEDAKRLPPPERLEKMSADDMLLILAASDPGGALRAWARQQHPSDIFDHELDAAMPPDLNPLKRYDLQQTFLKRVGRRARILARLRENLQRPAWSVQALEWRLRGLVGIERLADRMLREYVEANGQADESLLTLADLLIVLKEVDYRAEHGALGEAEFERVYKPFLSQLARRLDGAVRSGRRGVPRDLLAFWARVVKRCQ